MSIRQKLAYWLLKTTEKEVREQFRRLEQEVGQSTELVQTQALLKINPAQKPEPYNVRHRVQNYIERS